jgi:RNA polymerase sigma-70 factor (ECF subfamily)
MATCLARVRQRDEEAARLLMERLHPLVVKLVRAHLPRRTSEEDLVQMVFLKVFANLAQYSGRVPVEHWVSRVAVNTCLNVLKAEKVRPELCWSEMSPEEQHVVESLAAHESDRRPAQTLAARDLLEKLLARLSPEDRLVVHLLHLEERSVAEVQAVTGWSAPGVKVRAFRARKKLQKHLQQLAKEEHM